MVECISCDKTFSSEHGMKIHHTKVHGESLSGVNESCYTCDDEIRVSKTRDKRYDKHFCSDECRGMWISNTNTGHAHPNYNSIERVCSNCGDTQLVQKWRDERVENIFCNKKCYGRWMESNFLGSNNPNYSGGYNDYGGDWTKISRAVRSRDKCCQRCGLSNEECVEEYSMQLHVHHIKPFKSFNDTETANKLSNLKSYCPSCHVIVEDG